MGAGAKVLDTLKFYKPKFIIQWNHWGRTMAMGGSQLLFIGGFLSLLYGFPIQFLIGLYSILLGGIVFPLVYPVAKLQEKGFIYVFQLYYAVGPGLLVASLPCYFALPTMLGAIPLSISGIFYIIAAIRKEKNLTKEQVMKGGRV